MITSASPEWVPLSAIYHHALKQTPSPEAAKIAIASARKDKVLRLRAEEIREREPGEKVDPKITHDQPIPHDTRFSTWDWERSYATRRDAATKSHFEYVNIVGHRDDLLALWPNAEPKQGFQSRRLAAAFRKAFPPDGQVSDDVTTAAVHRKIDAELAAENKEKGSSTPDRKTIARYLGREKK